MARKRRVVLVVEPPRNLSGAVRRNLPSNLPRNLSGALRRNIPRNLPSFKMPWNALGYALGSSEAQPASNFKIDQIQLLAGITHFCSWNVQNVKNVYLIVFVMVFGMNILKRMVLKKLIQLLKLKIN